MAQRFTAIMAAIGAAACIAVCFFLWQFVQDSRASQAASLAEMRDFNAKLLEGLQRPAETSAENNEWANVRVQVVNAEDEGPAAEVRGTLSGGPIGSDSETGLSLRAQSGADGILDFGSVPHGKYTLNIVTPDRSLHNTEQLLVGPDRPQEVIITVPRLPTGKFTHFDLGMMDGVIAVKEKVRFVISMVSSPLQVGGREWQPSQREVRVLADHTGRVLSVLSDDGSGSLSTDNGRHAYVWQFDNEREDWPSLPARYVIVAAYEPLESELAPRIRRQADLTEPNFVGYRLLTYKIPRALEASPHSNKEGIYRLPMPSEFWEQLAHAQVLAGLLPPRPGTQIVNVSVAETPQANEPGSQVSVVAFLGALQPGKGQEALYLMDAAEITSVITIPSPLGGVSGWEVSLLVTDEQAATLRLAQEASGVSFRVNRAIQDSFDTNLTNNDATIRERLQEAIDARRPVEDLSDSELKDDV